MSAYLPTCNLGTLPTLSVLSNVLATEWFIVSIWTVLFGGNSELFIEGLEIFFFSCWFWFLPPPKNIFGYIWHDKSDYSRFLHMMSVVPKAYLLVCLCMVLGQEWLRTRSDTLFSSSELFYPQTAQFQADGQLRTRIYS